jgi:pimeloyl-[acyl-carrier protein] methyl ester esterase
VKARLLFVHGWALDRTLWDGVLAALGEDAADAVVLDRGYFGRPAAPEFPHDRPLLGVGQSLGALELLADPPQGLCGLVAIDAFARFAAAPDFPQGQPVRVLQRMARRLTDSPVLVVTEFLDRAGGNAPGASDAEALGRGLERLERLDGRAAARLPIWRLHVAADPIAPLDMADASFAGAAVRERRVREGQDHLSPLSAPQACAALIRQALKALAA